MKNVIELIYDMFCDDYIDDYGDLFNDYEYNHIYLENNKTLKQIFLDFDFIENYIFEYNKVHDFLLSNSKELTSNQICYLTDVKKEFDFHMKKLNLEIELLKSKFNLQ
jgi:hypothetical protein